MTYWRVFAIYNLLAMAITLSTAQQVTWRSVWLSYWSLNQEEASTSSSKETTRWWHTEVSEELLCAVLATNTPWCRLFLFTPVGGGNCSLSNLSVPSNLKREATASHQGWTRGITFFPPPLVL